jgi:ATP-binding cassette, subfamily B, multidrug efflux pump
MLEKLKEPFRYPFPAGTKGDSSNAAGKKRQAKASDMGGTIKRIWGYLLQHRVRLSLVAVLIVASSGLSLLGPYLAGAAIDRFIDGGESGFGIFLFAMGAVYAIHSLTVWFQSIWMITISQRVVLQMRTELFARLHRLPIPFFGKRQQGELMSRATNDIENVSATLNSSLIQVFSSILLLVGIVVVMLLLSPLLTLITFAVVPLMFFGMKWITNRTSRMFKAQQRNIGDLNGFVEETLSGQGIIKAFSRENEVKTQFGVFNKRIHQSGFWAQAISGFIPKLMNGLNNFSFALIAGAGSLLVLNGNSAVTVGTIVIFAEYSRQFTRPLNDLANQWNTLLSAVAGAERVFQIMDEEAEDKDEAGSYEIRHVAGRVEFQEVSFSYDRGRPTLSNVSFAASPGEIVAFVGPTGAGKTTLIQLLCRFYEPDSGQILLDGANIATIKRESLRSHMAFVLQDPFLFEGTIRENIRYGKLDATDEEVIEAAKLANAHSFIVRMKGGYDARLKLDGAGISQGQKQLLAIARAILAEPSVLVLDEATSSIDTVTEIKIQDALQRLMQGRTSFVIAHRLNTITQADRIVVLQDGSVSEQGTHEELLRKGGFYSTLVKGRHIDPE